MHRTGGQYDTQLFNQYGGWESPLDLVGDYTIGYPSSGGIYGQGLLRPDLAHLAGLPGADVEKTR